jgi:peptidoglycan/LPS O-acetylase OafA/YrhL
MNNYSFTLSETNSININIIRIFSIQIIALSHGLENIGVIGLSNIVGVSGFDLLMLISGLLIAYSILRNMNNPYYDFKKYLVSRFSRIYISILTIYPIIVIIVRIEIYILENRLTKYFLKS